MRLPPSPRRWALAAATAPLVALSASLGAQAAASRRPRPRPRGPLPDSRRGERRPTLHR